MAPGRRHPANARCITIGKPIVRVLRGDTVGNLKVLEIKIVNGALEFNCECAACRTTVTVSQWELLAPLNGSPNDACCKRVQEKK
jgi:hypothetical protein